jgi:predicted DNA binding protein
MIEKCLVVEFAVTGDDCPLAEASKEAGVTIDCGPPQLRADDNVLLRFSATDDSGRLAAVLDADDRIRYLHVSESDGRTNFRCLSKHPCVVHELTDVGFMSESLQYRDGTGAFTGAVVGHDVLRGVLDRAGETVGVTLERVHPLGSGDEEAIARRWNVTPAQEEALRAAYRAGYFSVPKEASAEAVAGELAISKSAFLERLRRGQATLFAQMFA